VATAAAAKAVAPRPGQKPDRNRSGKPASVRPGSDGADSGADGAVGGVVGGLDDQTVAAGGDGPAVTSGSSEVVSASTPRTPRPGQRPTRAGNRPPAKRPSQAKKRR
jgi:hypothetical protein